MILNPSPFGGFSISTPPPSVLNNTPASPEPILTDDLEIKRISKIDNSIIGNPIFGKFFIFNNYLS